MWEQEGGGGEEGEGEGYWEWGGGWPALQPTRPLPRLFPASLAVRSQRTWPSRAAHPDVFLFFFNILLFLDIPLPPSRIRAKV